MAYGGKSGVVRLRRHGLHFAAQRLPQCGDLLQRANARAAGGGENDLLAAIQVGIGIGNAGHFLACDRVGGHELADARPECGFCRLNHVLFGGADIGDDGVLVQAVCNGQKYFFAGSHRHGYHHQVCLRHGIGRAVGGCVNHAHVLGLLQGLRIGAVSHDVAYQAGALHGQGQRAAHETASDQGQTIEHGGVCCCVYSMALLMA